MEKQKAAAVLSAVFLLTALAGPAGTPARAGNVLPGTDAETEAAARAVLGSRTILDAARVGPYVLYSCRNGYALTDPADGRVVEYALSFPEREPVFARPEPDPDPGPSPTE